jgi:hypothetical protein
MAVRRDRAARATPIAAPSARCVWMPFESEAAAQALVDMTQGAPAMSVTLDSIEVGKVIAHA